MNATGNGWRLDNHEQRLKRLEDEKPSNETLAEMIKGVEKRQDRSDTKLNWILFSLAGLAITIIAAVVISNLGTG